MRRNHKLPLHQNNMKGQSYRDQSNPPPLCDPEWKAKWSQKNNRWYWYHLIDRQRKVWKHPGLHSFSAAETESSQSPKDKSTQARVTFETTATSGSSAESTAAVTAESPTESSTDNGSTVPIITDDVLGLLDLAEKCATILEETASVAQNAEPASKTGISTIPMKSRPPLVAAAATKKWEHVSSPAGHAPATDAGGSKKARKSKMAACDTVLGDQATKDALVDSGVADATAELLCKMGCYLDASGVVLDSKGNVLSLDSFLPPPAKKRNTLEKKADTRVQQKRLVGKASTTVNQMKDSIVHNVAASTAYNFGNLASMSTYDSEGKRSVNPECTHFMLNYDDIVPNPRSFGSDFEKKKDKPTWNVLAQPHEDKHETGRRFVELGFAMMDTAPPQSIRAQGDACPFDVLYTHDCSEYIKSIYGAKGKEQLRRMKRFK
jgi:hypothetical protein